jgi:hypothetical protein
VDTALSEVLVFKLFRAKTATGAVTPPSVVVTLDIIKHRRSHYFPADKVLAVDTFHLQRVEETFRTGIIVTATSGAHTRGLRANGTKTYVKEIIHCLN